MLSRSRHLASISCRLQGKKTSDTTIEVTREKAASRAGGGVVAHGRPLPVADGICRPDMGAVGHPAASLAVEGLDDVNSLEKVAEVEADEFGGERQRAGGVGMENGVEFGRIEARESAAAENGARGIPDDVGHSLRFAHGVYVVKGQV